MNRKQFIVLVLFFVLVGAAGWIVYQHGNNSWQSAGHSIGGNLLPNLSVNDVAQITIKSGPNDLVLARRDNLWCVRQRNDYPADFSKISDLLVKLAGLKIVQKQEVAPSQLARFDLLPPDASTNSGTRVELDGQNGKALASLLLGKQHMNQSGGDEGWADGRYLIVGNDAKNVIAISDPLDAAQPTPANWLDKTFFKIQNPKSVAVTFPIATNSWKLTRASQTNDWKLADATSGEKLDSSKLNDVTHPFDSPEFNDVTPGTVAPKDATRVNVETFDGLIYSAKVWPDSAGNYFMALSVSPAGPQVKNEKPEDKTVAGNLAADQQFENWTYQVPAYTVDSLLKPRSQLLADTQDVASPKSVATK